MCRNIRTLRRPDLPATDEEIRGAMNGILCRCFTHTRMMRAIRKYTEEKKHENS